eukprot:10440760-Alexandrium_andersonii.AAC.1
MVRTQSVCADESGDRWVRSRGKTANSQTTNCTIGSVSRAILASPEASSTWMGGGLSHHCRARPRHQQTTNSIVCLLLRAPS